MKQQPLCKVVGNSYVKSFLVAKKQIYVPHTFNGQTRTELAEVLPRQGDILNILLNEDYMDELRDRVNWIKDFRRDITLKAA